MIVASHGRCERRPRSGGARSIRVATLGLALFVAAAAEAEAQPAFGPQPRATVLENATIIGPGGEAAFAEMIVFRGETIEHVGRSIEVQGRTTRLDLKGAFVTPGLIDVWSALGMTATRSASPVHKAFDAFDRYNADVFREAFRNGVTMMYLPAAGASGVAGTGAIVRLAPGQGGGWAGEVVREDATLCIDLGSGESALRRLATLDAVRKQFKDAKAYRESLETYEDELKEYEQKIKERAEKEAKEKEKEKKEGEKPAPSARPMQQPPPDQPPPAEGAKPEEKKEEIAKPRRPSTDLGAEVLLKALDREMPVRVRADRSSDILNALDLAREYHLDVIIEGGAEAHLVAEALAEAEAPVVLGSLLGPGLHQANQYRRADDRAAAVLTEAGVKWALGSGGGEGAAGRFILLNAQMLAANAPAIDPLRLLTRDAAEFLGIGDRFGRLEPRRAADLVVWSGHPLEAGSRVQRVYVDGRLVFRDDGSAAPETAREGEEP